MPDEQGLPLAGEHAEEISALRKQHEALSEKNLGVLRAIGTLGAQIDPSMVASTRLNVFIGYIFSRLGNTSPELRQVLQLGFEVEFEQAMHDQLSEIQRQVRHAQLTGGGVTMDQIKDLMARKSNGKPNAGPPGGLLRGPHGDLRAMARVVREERPGQVHVGVRPGARAG